jgi:hypothetical protein
VPKLYHVEETAHLVTAGEVKVPCGVNVPMRSS